MKLDTRVLPDIDALSRAALEELLSDLQDAITQRGRGAIALSGGHTPEKMYALWAANEKYRNETDWNRVHLFWGDERYVPHDDPLSNYRMTREALLAHVPIPAANVHAVPTNLATPQQAAEAYDQELRKFFGSAAPAFDVTLLGSGSRGPHRFAFSGFPRAGGKNTLGRGRSRGGRAAKPPDVYAPRSEFAAETPISSSREKISAKSSPRCAPNRIPTPAHTPRAGSVPPMVASSGFSTKPPPDDHARKFF